MFVVTCLECVERIAEYPDLAGAEAWVHRHHILTGHDPRVEVAP